MTRDWKILCCDCEMIKSDKGAVKVGTDEKWAWRCKDCCDLLEQSLKDLGVL